MLHIYIFQHIKANNVTATQHINPTDCIMKTYDVFISYSSQQKNVADAICHVLEENNIKCWIAPRDIPVGEKYAAVITRAIKECKITVLVFSEFSAVSPWVESEINIAFSNHKPIIPYKVDHTKLSDYDEFYLMLDNRHWIESIPDFRTRFNELVNTIANMLEIDTVKNQTEPRVKYHHTHQEEEIETPQVTQKHGLINIICIADCVLSLVLLMEMVSVKEGPWTVFLLIRMGCVVPLIFNSIKGSIVMLIAGFIFAMYISADKNGGITMLCVLVVTAIVYALLLSLRKNGMSAWKSMLSQNESNQNRP